MKTCLFKYTLRILPPKNENFQMKNSGSFHISAQNKGCGYLLELPCWDSSNKCPQSMFLSRSKKMYTPENPSFTYIGMFSWCNQEGLIIIIFFFYLSCVGLHNAGAVPLTTDPGPKVIKLFLCSTQLSMNFFLLINLKLLTIANSFVLNIDWSWNIFYGHSLPSADSRRAVVSFWRKNVHNTG